MSELPGSEASRYDGYFESPGMSPVWVSAELRPMPGQVVLTAAGGAIAPGYHDGRAWIFSDQFDDEGRCLAMSPIPTHWMPLPDPPDAPARKAITSELTDGRNA